MRWLGRLLGVICLSLVLCCYWLLATSAGTRWSLTMLPTLLPDLQLEFDGGTWLAGVEVSRLRYSNPVVEVTISGLFLSIKPLALLGGTLAVGSVAADKVVLRLIDSGVPPSGDGLPTVSLPLTLSVAHVAVPQFELITRGGTRVLAAIDTALRWRGTWINATDATLLAYGYRIDTDLAIELRGDYAVDTNLELRRPGQSHVLDAELSGSLMSLQVDGGYRGLAPLTYRGEVRLLDKGLPLSLQLEAEPGAPLLLGDQSLGDNMLVVQRGELEIAGDLNTLSGSLQVTLDHQQLGPVHVHAPLAWHDAQLFIERGSLQSDHGAITTDCSMAMRTSQWQCGGHVSELSPAAWFDAVPMLLSSPFELGGGWGEQSTALALDLPALSGRLGEQALRGSVTLDSADWQQWNVHQLQLVAGANRLDISGGVGQELDLRVRVAADDLSQLSPAVAGAFNGRFEVVGPLSAPTIAGRTQGSELLWGALSIPRMRGHVDVADLGKGKAEARLRMSELHYGQQNLGDLKLSLDGTFTRPRLVLELDGGDHRFALQCEGLQGAHWQLRCAQLEGVLTIRAKAHAFAIDEPLQIEWREQDSEFRLVANCLRMPPARLCLPQPLQVRGNVIKGLNLSLRRLPLQWWYGALPSTITAQDGSYLEADLRVESFAPLQALLTARIDEVHWTWRGEGGTFPASMEAILLRLALEEQRAVLTGEANSSAVGGLRAMLVVDDPAGRQALDGRLLIDDLQLRAFSWLSETIQRLRGVIDGNIEIGGTAAAPRLDGVLTLRDGLLQDVSLPFPLEQVSVDVALHQDWANISGRFRLNDGDGTLQGKLRWQEQAPVWRMDATVATETITLPVLENSTAGVAARLVLGLEPGLIDVGGKILVDEADIRLVALPPESISTSPDSEMIGVSSRSAWRLNSDLEIDLGDDLRFRGFGVDMTLAGRLRLRNSRRYNNHITGEVNVQRGRFRAYGQDLTIRNGRVIFAGLANNPDLQLEAIRQSRDRNTIGGLRVTGTLQEPVGEFFAEPSMTDSDVAYFLLTGRRPPEPGQKDTTSGGALLNLGLARTNESAAKLASRLGIEGFQISTADGEQGLETHLSGYLSDDLFVSYGTGFEENTASLTLQYYITPHVVIEAVGGFTSALDIVYSFRVD